MSVSVLVAARNEERWIGACIAAAFASGADEVIVADGGSSDQTREIASGAGATVIECEPMRSRQLNRAAQAARGDALIFLHADTMLPAGAAAAVASALDHAEFGGFRISFSERSAGLRLAALLINLRTQITKCPWGDQAQFIRRDTFLRDGGFREIPLMDDYELAVRMRRRGRPVMLPLTVMTSGRRFLTKGLLRTPLLNWSIVLAWRFGVPAERLVKWYRS